MDHLIHRQILEVELRGKGDPFPLQHEVSRVCREALPRILEAVFDELAPGPTHHRLERLELDLGALGMAELERGLLERVRDAVREALDRAPRLARSGASAMARRVGATPSRPDQGEMEVLSPQAADEELLRSFLETGLVPWWAGRPGGAELEERFVSMMELRGGRAPEWLRGHGGSARMAQRVVGQFSRTTVLRLVEALAREAGAERALAALLEAAPAGLVPTTWRQAVVEAVLPELLAWPVGTSWPEERLVTLAVETAARHGVTERALRAALLHHVEGSLLSRPSEARAELPMVAPAGAAQVPGTPSGGTPLPVTSEQEPGSREMLTPRQSAREIPEPRLALPREPFTLSMPDRPEAHATPGEPSRASSTRAGSEQVPQRLAPQPEAPRTRTSPGEPRPQEPVLLEPMPRAAPALDGQRVPSPSALPAEPAPISDTLPPSHSGAAAPPLELNDPSGPREAAAPEPSRSPSPVPPLQEAAGHMSTPRPRQDVGAFPPHREPSGPPQAQVPSEPRAPDQQAPTPALSDAPPRAREPALAPRAPRLHGAPPPSTQALPPLETALERASTYGLPVDNAGLVLLHPFLKTFFQAVGLLEGKGFRDPQARCRAVCLLQWLAHEDGAEDEHRMALSKVLCGLPLEKVVPRIDGPTEAERTEGEELLRHVVAQWTVLKNTSIRGLRESFLQREGLLRRDDMGWVLRMEARAYDMLLDRLPWGLSHIRLSWMSALLRVER